MPLRNAERRSRELWMRARQDFDGVQPGLDEGGPGGDGESGGTEAVAVAAFGVDVEFGGDFGVL